MEEIDCFYHHGQNSSRLEHFHKDWTEKDDNSFITNKSLQDNFLCGTLKIAISEINTISLTDFCMTFAFM